MSHAERKFHETWMGMVQPIDGLVFSLPVLVDGQVMDRTSSLERQKTFASLLDSDQNNSDAKEGKRPQWQLVPLLTELLGYRLDDFDAGEAPPEDLSLWVPEGHQLIKPTLALKRFSSPAGVSPDLNGEASPDAQLDGLPDDNTPQSIAGRDYEILLWDVSPAGLAAATNPSGAAEAGESTNGEGSSATSKAPLDLDKSETQTGPWDYPAAAKFDRLLRACRVPIGILFNGEVLRLVYAPHGESSGAITFRLEEMATVGGRPILDAFHALLCVDRTMGMQAPGGVDEEQSGSWPLSRLLRESRKRQANVTNQLADQIFDALELLLQGFEQAAERDGWDSLRDALDRGEDHLYGGLLTVLLRLVFALYAEDRGLMPTEHPYYAQHLSLLALFDELQEDNGSHPDSMSQRFGAWPRLVTLFRSIFLGVKHGDFEIPPRRGQLFDPNEYPFLEGWLAGSAPIKLAEHRAQTRVPSVDDGTVFQVLHRLLVLDGQRLSYRALDVEQIGSVYEALMGYHAVRLFSDAVCLKAAKARGGVWVEVQDLLDTKPARRDALIVDETGLSKSALKKASKDLKAASDAEGVVEALGPLRRKKTPTRAAGRLVLQPGKERRRTSSHYTPPSLTTPIVKRTLEPLLKVMGDTPSSDRLLNLKICDPAMGSGAFLVAVVKFLADQVVAAWTREGKLGDDSTITDGTEDVVHIARRLVAQRCVYGVDKNPYAVNLAKLSLWLTTLAKNEPFTFLDHALRHGDSLVGLDLEQIRAFTWEKPKAASQVDWCAEAIASGLEEAMAHRRDILALADAKTPSEAREKERLLQDAEFAIGRARLVGDLIVGAFFSEAKDKARKAELNRRMMLVQEWLDSDAPAPGELLELQAQVREQTPVFHWALEFPEVFWEERPDPLDDNSVNRAADMDAFVGNPPFLGGKRISTELGDKASRWLGLIHPDSGNADLSAHFFRACARLLGDHGSFGLIATNTIAQGDTRATGLQHLVNAGAVIYDATRSFKWPGEANVAVALAHVAFGNVGNALEWLRLDGVSVPTINSRFRGKPERPDPVSLDSNRSKAFVGSYVLGMGFTLTPRERDDLVQKAGANAERIFPYLGGKEVNTSPTQSHDRYVISFFDGDLSFAQKWPDLISRVRELVKPERDKVKRKAHREYWWHFGDKRPALYKAIAPLKRCLVTARVTKHLCLSFQPTDRVLNEKLYVFPFDDEARFALLQSRIHAGWTWLLSSTLEDRLNYSATDCFETFPFPRDEAFEESSALNAAGKRLYDARAKFMVDTDQGLTITYNLLKDREVTDARIEELRQLHVEMDRAVLAAYGWDDIDIPPFVDPTTVAERKAKEAFDDEVIDRLFALNAERAAEEKLAKDALSKQARAASTAAKTKTESKKKTTAKAKSKTASAKRQQDLL